MNLSIPLDTPVSHDSRECTVSRVLGTWRHGVIVNLWDGDRVIRHVLLTVAPVEAGKELVAA